MAVSTRRRSIEMPDGTFRQIPSVSEVPFFLRLDFRVFPDGTSRLSFSLRGVWILSNKAKFFGPWSAPILSKLRFKPGSTYDVSTDGGDVIVDAEMITAVVGKTSVGSMGAVRKTVMDRMAMAEHVRDELIAQHMRPVVVKQRGRAPRASSFAGLFNVETVSSSRFDVCQDVSDYGLSIDTLSMTVSDFLIFSMIPDSYVVVAASLIEQDILLEIVEDGIVNGFCRLPVDGRVFFARGVLNAWWVRKREDVVRAAIAHRERLSSKA